MARAGASVQVCTSMLGIEPLDKLCPECFLPALHVATAAMTAHAGDVELLPWGVMRVVVCADCHWQR